MLRDQKLENVLQRDWKSRRLRTTDLAYKIYSPVDLDPVTEPFQAYEANNFP